MDNRLRETAVSIAVWASSQHAISEVWFAGPRLVNAEALQQALEIIVVLADHEQQVEARRAGRQISQSSWETDIHRAVRGAHVLKTLTSGTPVSDPQAVRIFTRRAEVAPDIVTTTQRNAAHSSNSYKAVESGEIGNVRPL